MALDPRVKQLLVAIEAHRIVPIEERDIELASPQSNEVGVGTAAEERERLIEDEKMDSLGDAFETGLRIAARSATAGQAEIRLDARDALQSTMADALIQFLVRPRLAAVRTEEVGAQQYVYYVTVNWDELHRFAASAGLNLDEVTGTSLTSHSSS